MSSTSSPIVLLLLCVALYSCNARQIGVINKETKTAKISHFSSMNEEKSNLAWVSMSSNEKPPIQNKSEAAKGDLSSLVENMVNKNNQGIKAQKLVERKDDDHKRPKVEADDHRAAQTESLATLSWKLSHRKRREQQPGFNLDYSPPKTHPPIHN